MTTLELVRDDLAGMSADEKRMLARKLWHRARRSEQRPPDGGWRTWYLQGGRGSGKTRAAAEAFAEMIEASEPGDWAVIAPKYGDARDVCIEGQSGLLQALGLPRTYHGWNRSLGELRLPHGGTVFVDGADDGALRVQGKNLRGAWCDEVGLWRNWQIAWSESLAFAVRLAPARIIASGTPKEGHGLVRLLIEDPAVPKSVMRTRDNLRNLSPAAVAELEARYAGTRRGRQELEGEFLTDTPGALWTRHMYDTTRVQQHEVPDLTQIAVAVDPSGGDQDGNDEQGIVVVGRGVDGHGYTLADRSCRLSPDGWGRRAVQAYLDFEADEMVVEANFGGDMAISVVTAAARAMGVSVPVRKVTASRGKRLRAEPVAALFEQGRAHHVGVLVELEDQACSWTPDSGQSPDRLDAEVWAYTAVMLGAERRRLTFRGAA